MIWTLIAMPFISIVPTLGYVAYLRAGNIATQNLDIFIANFPIFWVPYFVAGMLMTRVFSLSRYIPAPSKPATVGWGDVAFIMIVAIAITPGIEQPLKFLIRQGLAMPLYMMLLLDLACGRGVVSRLFSLPGTGFLGEMGYQIWISVALIMGLAIPSTYLIEKPLTRVIRDRWID